MYPIGGADRSTRRCIECKNTESSQFGRHSLVEASCRKRHLNLFHLDCISKQKSIRADGRIICNVCREPVKQLRRNGEDLAIDAFREGDLEEVRKKIEGLNIDSETDTCDSGNILTTAASNGRSEGAGAQAGAVFNREKSRVYTRTTSSPYSVPENVGACLPPPAAHKSISGSSFSGSGRRGACSVCTNVKVISQQDLKEQGLAKAIDKLYENATQLLVDNIDFLGGIKENSEKKQQVELENYIKTLIERRAGETKRKRNGGCGGWYYQLWQIHIHQHSYWAKSAAHR